MVFVLNVPLIVEFIYLERRDSTHKIDPSMWCREGRQNRLVFLVVNGAKYLWEKSSRVVLRILSGDNVSEGFASKIWTLACLMSRG